MKIRQWLFRILRKQNVTDGRTHGHTDGQRENSIPTTNKSCGGYKKVNFFYRSVQYWRKSERIIFSNIQIHCCCCFELPIKTSYHNEEFYSSYDILSIFFMVKHPTSVFPRWQKVVLVKIYVTRFWLLLCCGYLKEPFQWYIFSGQKIFTIRVNVHWVCTVKPVLSSHSKIDKTKILMTNGSLMKVECIAECSPCVLYKEILGKLPILHKKF